MKINLIDAVSKVKTIDSVTRPSLPTHSKLSNYPNKRDSVSFSHYTRDNDEDALNDEIQRTQRDAIRWSNEAYYSSSGMDSAYYRLKQREAEEKLEENKAALERLQRRRGDDAW